MKKHEIGRPDLLEAIDGHIEGMADSDAYITETGFALDEAMSVFNVMMQARKPLEAPGGKEVAYMGGLMDGLVIGARAAIAAMKREMDEARDIIRCFGCGAALNVTKEEMKAKADEIMPEILEQIEELKAQGLDVGDDVGVEIKPAPVCPDCAKRFVAPLN